MCSSWLWSRSHRAAPVNFCRSHQADIARYEYEALSSELICSFIASTTRMFMPAILPLPDVISDGRWQMAKRRCFHPCHLPFDINLLFTTCRPDPQKRAGFGRAGTGG